ncbi:hypothetical protein D3C76_1188140 [compost metagenome]
MAEQRLVESARQQRQRVLLRRAAEVGRLAEVGQQPDHDVAGATLLKSLGAGSQAGTGGHGVGRAVHQALQEVVAAAGQVVQRIGVSAQAVGQVAGFFSQYLPAAGVPWRDDGLGRGRDRIQDLLGGIAADSPVVAIGADAYRC